VDNSIDLLMICDWSPFLYSIFLLFRRRHYKNSIEIFLHSFVFFN